MAFDPAAYLAANRDVAEAGMDPWTHFQQYGMAEGRSLGGGTSTVDQAIYNPHLIPRMHGETVEQAQQRLLGWRASELRKQAENPQIGTAAPIPLDNFVPGGGGLSESLNRLIGGAPRTEVKPENYNKIYNPNTGGFETYNPSTGRVPPSDQSQGLTSPGKTDYYAPHRPGGSQTMTGLQTMPMQVSGQSNLTGNLGMGGLNPYQKEMFDAVTNQVTSNLNRNILPGIRSASVATGGYGGSRQGVVEANALNDANQGLSNTLGNIQYTDWNNLQNRQLTNKGMDQSFYTAQRGQDLAQMGLGANLFQQGTQGMLGQGQGIYNLGLTAQQAPWQTLAGFTGVSSPYTGYGSTSQSASGNMLGGAMGGAMMGGQIYNAWRGNAGQPASSGQNMSYVPGMQPFNINNALG